MRPFQEYFLFKHVFSFKNMNTGSKRACIHYVVQAYAIEGEGSIFYIPWGWGDANFCTGQRGGEHIFSAVQGEHIFFHCMALYMKK